MRMILTGVDGRANASGFRAPVSTGLAGWWWLGGSQTASQKDYAYIGNGSLVGAPTINSSNVAFEGYSAGDWLQTEVAETADFTFLCVVKTSAALAAAATKPMLMGYFTGDSGYSGQANGSCLYFNSTSGLPQGFVTGTTGHVTAGTVSLESDFVSVPDVSVWRFYALTFNDSTNAKVVYDKTAGTSTTGTETAARSPHTTALLRVGGGYNTSFSGACDMAFAAAYSTALTAQDITDTYTFVQTCLSDWHGITI